MHNDKLLLMNPELSKNFGARVRTLRNALGLSQEKLAEKAGVHRTYIGMIERGEKNITLSNIEKIACALGVSADTLFKKD